MKAKNGSIALRMCLLSGGVGLLLPILACSDVDAPPEIQRKGAALKLAAVPSAEAAPEAITGAETAPAEQAGPGAPTHALCDFALYSSHQSKVRDRVQVSGGLVGTSGTTVELAAYSRVLANVESMHNVDLRANAYVNGDVLAGGAISQEAGVVVTGSMWQNTAVNPMTIPTQTFSCNTSGWTTVENGQVRTLTPGSYANVAVRAGGKLVLQAGTYTFNSLRFESGGSSSRAAVDITAESDDLNLRTCGELYFGNFMRMNLLGATQASRLKFYSNTTGMVTVGTDMQFYGTVTAPSAEVHAYSRTTLTGSLYGRDVWIEPDSQLAGIGCPVAPVTFTPVKPSTCPTMTVLPWNYRIGGQTGVFDLPSDPNCSSSPGNPCPHYINYLDNSRWFVTNTWVSSMAYRVGFFSTEGGFDFMRWGSESISLGSVSGMLGAGSTLWSNTGASFGSVRDAVNFTADYSVTYEGVSLDQVQVCTSRSSVDTGQPNYLDLKRRYNGVLLGTNDVVYLRFAGDTTYHQPITLWDDVGSAGNNFDLYERCGALPTPTSYDARANSADSQEYLDVSGCSGTVYLAIHSRNGSGVFSVVRGVHSAAGHTGTLRAGTAFNATAAQMATFNATLQQAARHFYGSTEGEQIVDRIDLYNSQTCTSTSCGGGNCDICFVDEDGTAYAGCEWGVVVQHSYYGTGEGVSHEFGHYQYCIGDEYVNVAAGSIWQCGHSNMANPWGDNNNYCVDFDHGMDKNPDAPVCTNPSGMAQAFSQGTAVDSQNVTFDNYDYEAFDFNGAVGNIVQH